MKKQILVTGLSGISEAVRFVESNITADGQQTGTQICPLICEELLLRLLNMGCEEIRVTYKGILFPYIEISAKGERADALRSSPEAADNGIGTRISECLLEQYADLFTWQYRNEANVYRVFTEPERIMDLTDEISGFYKNADPEKAHKPTDVLRYIARRHLGFFSFSVFIHLLKHLAALMLPVFVANIINTVTETGAFFIPPVLVNILLSTVALIVNLVCYWIDSRFYRRFTRAVEAGFRMALVQKLQILSIRFHKSMQAGVVLSKLVSDVQYIQMLIYDRFMEVLYLCEDVLFITVIALINFPLMLVFYAVIIPVVVYMVKKFSGPLQDKRAGMRQKNEQVSAAVKEMLEMAGLTRAHGLERAEYRNILTRVRKAQGASVLYDRQTVSVNNITYGGFQGLRLLSLSFAALLTVAGRIEIGTLVLFQSIFEMIISNVQRMLDAMPLITQGYDSLKSVNEILYADDIEQNGTALLPSPVRGEIEFRHVSFSYAPDQEPVLKDVSFRIPAGGSIAFIGKSGEGKSTTLNLILGLYAAQKGEILIDGVNINTLDKPMYRRHIAVVPQQTVLFSGTLWDNLVYGLHYVTTDRVMDVIRRVGLEDLVASLPEGLNTQISESGGNLSGGQRQRVAIARALLRSPKIILLDEATSALDAESERQVQEAVDAMMGSCTVVMAAHRLHTLRHADIVCRIRNGRLEQCEDLGRSLPDEEEGAMT